MQWRIKELTDGGGGANFCKNLYTPQLALICSRRVRGHAPPEKFKISGLKWRIRNHISAEIWSFFCFWNPERGGGEGERRLMEHDIGRNMVVFFVFETLNGGGGGSAGLWSMISAKIWSFFLFLEPWTGGAPANGATNGAWYHYIDVFQMRYAG